MARRKYKRWHAINYIVILDQQITRRKRFHIIVRIADKQIVYRSRLLSDCLSWLSAEDQMVYGLQPLPDWSGPPHAVIKCEVGDEEWLN